MGFPLLSLEHGGRQLHALAAVFDSGSQKQRAQVLLHGPGADVQLLGDFLVAASFNQEVKNLFIASRNLDVAEIQHDDFLSAHCHTFVNDFDLNHAIRKATGSPKIRPKARRDKDL
jgi:hypothetical protein